MKQESEKAGLKLKLQKTKIMASSSIASWKIDGEKMETMTHFIFLGSKITADSDRSHEIKRRLLLGKKAMTNLDNILNRRNITLSMKVHRVKPVVFPVVQMWELDHKEGWALKNWYCQAVMLQKTLRVPWTARRSSQSILKELNLEYSLEGLMLKLKLQYFGHLIWRADSLEKTLLLGKNVGRKGSDQGWDGWMT